MFTSNGQNTEVQCLNLSSPRSDFMFKQVVEFGCTMLGKYFADNVDAVKGTAFLFSNPFFVGGGGFISVLFDLLICL